MVMVASNNRVVKVSISGDIDTVLISQDTSIIMPIREARAEFSGEFARVSMEGIEDKWIRSQGGVELSGKGGVNKIDEEDIRELVVSVRGWNMIRSMR